ncbi:hypothetical protein M3Y97_00251700 [Aphelenchoides bicaudatus]|nr:hypothetical protein M3Y97_00251700 [Aphelenchoides bicaudatus]
MSYHSERGVRVLSPDDTRSFRETGREEVHTIEAYEKRVHGENVEPTRQFSTNAYTERRTYGRDENGEVVVKIDKNPRDPVKPVSPVRPFGAASNSGGSSEHVLRPLPNFETTPLHIPRVDTRNSNKHGALSPGSTTIQWHDQVSPRSAPSPRPAVSPRSGQSSGFGSRPASANSTDHPIAANVPMKKITRKSRLVSIYDGRPVSDYVEKVHFEPADDQYEFSSRPNSRFSTHNSAAFRNDGVVLNGGRERFIPIQREDEGVHRLSRQPEWQPSYPTYNEESSRGVVITENPMFSNY